MKQKRQSKRSFRCILLLPLLFLFAIAAASSCGGGGRGGDGETAGGGATDGDISMITPYKNSSDMASINEAFSSTASAPWGFAHDGIDFFPNGNLKPFQAVSSGVVEVVQLMQNNITSNWQVNVRIRYNSTYYVEYSFEPFSTVQSDGNTQLANILISVGQNVAQGDIIGNLYTVGSAAHVHFGLYKNGAAICPEPYFTPEARTSILNLLYVVWPGANMCY